MARAEDILAIALKEIGTVEDIWQDELRNHQCRLLKLTKEA